MTDLDTLLAPALAADRAERDRHSLTGYSNPPGTPKGTCKCGWTAPAGTRSPARSLGLHIAAAEKAADKRFDAAVAEALAADRHR